MIRLTVATLVALYAVLYYLGDEGNRPDEAVARTEAPRLGVALANYLPDLPDEADFAQGRISEEEAVRQALEAGAAIRGERKSRPRNGNAVVLASANAPVAAVPAETGPTWYVTGSTVNLREGPGTSNPVVGQATFGKAAEVLEDRDGWYRIRLSDGSASGWIFGRFLSEQKPG